MGLKNLAMLPSYFDYSFVHLRQKVRFRPELSSKFLSTLGPNPNRKARLDLHLWVENKKQKIADKLIHAQRRTLQSTKNRKHEVSFYLVNRQKHILNIG